MMSTYVAMTIALLCMHDFSIRTQPEPLRLVHSASGRLSVSYDPVLGTLACVDATTRSPRWTMQAVPDADRLLLANAGACIVGVDGALHFYWGVDDNDKLEIELLAQIHPTELARYGAAATGGMLWLRHSVIRIYELDNVEYCGVRFWWGPRVCFNCITGEQVFLTDKLRAELDRSDSAWLMEELNEQLARGPTSADPGIPGNTERVSSLIEIVHLLGLLKAFESAEAIGTLVEWRSPLRAFSVGGVIAATNKQALKPGMYQRDRLHQTVDTTLRRLGLTPRGRGATVIPGLGGAWDVQALGDRSRWREIQQGSTLSNVVEVLGYPDYVIKDEWHYDLDKVTLIISWIDEVVDSIKERDPGLWETTLRDYLLVG